MNSGNTQKEKVMPNRNDAKAGDGPRKINAGYQPIGDLVGNGYQPEATGKPEGKNPPTGGSSVQLPPNRESGKKE